MPLKHRARIRLLTSKSCGISRRARYSLASLVFISTQIPFEITNCRRPVCFLRSSSGKVNIGGSVEPTINLQTTVRIPAGGVASPPSWCDCVVYSSSPLQHACFQHAHYALAQRLCHVRAHLRFLFKVLAAIRINNSNCSCEFLTLAWLDVLHLSRLRVF